MPTRPPSARSRTRRVASPPPAGRRPRKGDRTTDAIVATAERLLADRPLAEISVDELAAGAGISRPTFYFHFASREAVLYALAERRSEELYRSATLWLRRSDESPADAVRRAVAAAVALWRAHGPVLRALVRGRDSDPELRRFWTEVGRRFVDATADQIERERAAGLAQPGPPPARALAAVLLAMVEQSCFSASMRPASAAADAELVDALTAVWLRSVYA